MFTGLIENIGQLLEMRRENAGAVMQVRSTLPMSEIKLGDSVACNGVCLTVTEKFSDSFKVFLSSETLERSTFARIRSGAKINLERALSLGDRLGGHLVSGHVDDVGRLLERTSRGESLEMRFGVDKKYMKYLAEKGSVSLDGISLTVAGLFDSGFSIVVIPHTLQNTTLESMAVGDEVNIEFDQIAKYIERLILASVDSSKSGGVSMALLEQYGFKK